MKLPIAIVNAFADGPFTGNPAAVVVTEKLLSDELMQFIAAQNNLSETVFVTLDQQPFGLRWFTPKTEIDLCGHATLAAAQVLFSQGYVSGDTISFASLSGELGVRRTGDTLQLDFPARPAVAVDLPSKQDIAAALGCSPEMIEFTVKAKCLMVVLNDEALLAQIQPDLERLKHLDEFAVIITAESRQVDFVVRFFAPNAGIDEDPVTGSAYTTLAPYWADRLGKTRLKARQLSARGGAVECSVQGSRVLISGRVDNYLVGEIEVE